MKIKNKNLYFVGGVVRDKILGLASADIDFCYVGNAIEFTKEFNILKINPDFGTVRVISEDGAIDIASTRTEIYPIPGHLPVIEKIGCSLEEDLKRRDFTINAMAQNTVTGEITDYFGGLNDIKNKKIRVLHDKSFIDDPSRIIRALKFSIRFDFELEAHTKKLQEEYLANINYNMSYYRIKKELKEAFSINSDKVYHRFVEQGLYKLLGANCTAPKLTGDILILNDRFKPIYPYMVYLGLFDLSNLELTNEEQNILKGYQNLCEKNFITDIELYKAFKEVPIESIIMYTATINYEKGLNFLENLLNVKIEITGKELKELGIKPSKIYKKILNFVLEEKLKNPKLSKQNEIEIVKTFLSTNFS